MGKQGRMDLDPNLLFFHVQRQHSSEHDAFPLQQPWPTPKRASDFGPPPGARMGRRSGSAADSLHLMVEPPEDGNQIGR